MAGLSACLIVRDEARMLGGCLASIRPWVEEICVVDTGSLDDTMAIARRFDARVSSVVWRSDFTHARNASLALATEPWILVIDADEELEQPTGPALRQAIDDPQRLAFLVDQVNLRPQGAPGRLAIPRLFRNRADIRYDRPVHESVMDSLFALGVRALDPSGVNLVHHGYLPEIVRERQKHQRNLAILRRRHVDAPDDLYSTYKLATTLPPDARDEKRGALEDAHAQLHRLSAATRAEMPFLPTLLDTEVAFLTQEGRLTEAISVADEARAQHPDSGQLDWRRGDLARRVGDYSFAQRLLRAALDRPRTSTFRIDSLEGLRALCWTSLLALVHEADRPLLALADLDAETRRQPSVQVAELRLHLAAGRVTEASVGLGALLETHFDEDEVRLFGGEVAWTSGDLTTAQTLWSMTDAGSDAGHRARAWLDLLALQTHAPVAPARPPRDVPSAAMAALVAEHTGRIPVRDTAFDLDAIKRWQSHWERLLDLGRSKTRPSG